MEVEKVCLGVCLRRVSAGEIRKAERGNSRVEGRTTGYRVEYGRPIVLGFPYALRLASHGSPVTNIQLAPE